MNSGGFPSGSAVKNLPACQCMAKPLHYCEVISLQLKLKKKKKNLPAVQEPQETQIRPRSWEDPLKEGMATYPSILAWRIPWTEKTGGLQSIGLQRVGHN